ncbi:MAG TPA: hypothetical protein VES19_06835, partial [Candidatus Limnocylindrales bacterium]|nr:hypothetical protein [Candidatus Limnocylindrales bacterium]
MTDPNTNSAQPESTAEQVPVAPVTPVTPMPVVKPKAKGSGFTNALLVVAALVAVGGVTFAIGRATAPASAASAFPGGQGRTGLGPGGSFDPGTMPGGAGPGGFGDLSMTITGTVKSLDGSTLVITTADGTETTIDVSGSTYHAQSPATGADVTAGTDVSVSVTGLGGMRRPGAG